MAASLTITNTARVVTKGVAGTGAEVQVDVGVGARRIYVYAEDEVLTVSTASTGTGAVTTSLEVPASTGLVIYEGPPLIGKLSVYVLQASAAGTAQFVVNF